MLHPSLFRPAFRAEVIVDHQHCVYCDYDLHGLKTGERCPECGTPIRPPRRHATSIAEAPQTYLRELEVGALSLAGGLALGLLWWLGAVHVAFLRLTLGWSLLAMAAASLWAWGVHRVSAPRRPAPGEKVDTVAEWRTLRRVARGSQWLWPVSAGLLFLGATLFVAATRVAAANAANAANAALPVAPAPYLPFVVVSTVLALGALAGVVSFCLLAANLAQWAQDYDLEKRLRAAPFMLLLSAPLLALYTILFPYLRGRWIPIFSWPAISVVGGLLATCLWFVVVPISQFIALCHWARRNAGAVSTRDRRASARIVQRIEKGQAKDDAAAFPVRPRPAARPQGNYLAPGSGDTLDLADAPPRHEN